MDRSAVEKFARLLAPIGGIIILGWLMALWLSERDRADELAARLDSATRTSRPSVAPVRPAPLPPPVPEGATVHYQGPSAQELASEEQMLRQAAMNYTLLKIRQRSVEKNFRHVLAGLRDLDPGQRAGLKNLLVERALAVSDARAAAAKLRLPLNSEEFRSAVSAATGEATTKIQSLLGDRFPEFQELDSLSGSMEIIQTVLGPDLAFADQPLDAGQEVQLAKVMRELHYSRDDPDFAGLVGAEPNAATGLSPLNERLVGRTRSFLTPAQIEVLKSYQKEQDAFRSMAPRR